MSPKLKANLWKFGSLALGGALLGLAAALPAEYRALAEVLVYVAGAVKGSALIMRPGDTKAV